MWVKRWQGAPLLLGRLQEQESSTVDGPLLCLLPHNLRSFLIFSPLTQFVDNPLPHSQRRHKSGKARSAGFASRFEQLEKHSVGLIGWFIR